MSTSETPIIPPDQASPKTIKLLEDLLTEGDKVVQTLKEKEFVDSDTGKLTKRVSDIKDDAGNQYVNLVQQGGGVLGIALLGYTYVLEKVGIRFLKLAGTSAGAINSSMLACIRPESVDTLKSPIILYYLASKDLFDLVDGHPLARTLIKNLIKTRKEGEPSYATKLINSIRFLLLASLPLILLSSLLLWQSSNGIRSLFIWVIISVFIAYVLYSKGQLTNWTTASDDTPQKPKGSSFLPIALFFVVASIFLLVAYLMSKLSENQGGQCDFVLFLELGPIVLLFLWSLFLVFNSGYYRPFQISYSAVLLILLVTAYFNKIEGVTILGNPQTRLLPYIYLSATGISLFLFFLLFVGSISVFLFVKFSQSRFGISPGKNFKNWIAQLMKDGSVNETISVGKQKVPIYNPSNNITTLSEFNTYLDSFKKAGLSYDPVISNKDEPSASETITKTEYLNTQRLNESTEKVIKDLLTYDPNRPPVTIITAEVITQNKIELPKMWPLFWESDAEVEPADFVRASMSLPVFFEAYKRIGIPKRDNSTRPDYWKKFLQYGGNVPKDAVFQDGGILSNFPISVFYEASLTAPRLPTFGIRLNDAEEPDSSTSSSLGGLLGSVFNTARYYFDKDFLITHPHYQLCIGNVDVRRFNWIDFNMDDAEKIKLFRQGALTAASFLENFDWQDYKKRRAEFRTGQNES